MSVSARRFGAVAVLLTIGCGISLSQANPARTDLYGTPLPVGTLARLGPSRMQHAGPVNSLVFSPDGKWLASAGADKVIRVWDTDNGKALFRLEGHQGPVSCIAFVPAGDEQPPRILISGGDDKTIRFWDLKTGKERKTVINHSNSVASLAASRDGKRFAFGSDIEPNIYLRQVADGTEIRRWKAHAGGVSGLAFAPDGKYIASGGRAQRQALPRGADDLKDEYGVAIWDSATGKARHTFAGHTTNVWAIALSSDGKLLASTGVDDRTGRSILLWDTEKGGQPRMVGTRGTGARFLAMSPDGKTLAGPDFNRVAVWDARDGAVRLSFHGPGNSQIEALAFSPDGKTLASVSEEGGIILWDVAGRTPKPKRVQGHTQPISSVAVSPDGATIATTSADGTAILWDRATSKPLHQLKHKNEPGVSSAAFSPDRRSIALSHQRAGITFWNVKTGQFDRRINEKRYDRIVSIVFSPDGKWLASESIDQPNASLWDTTTGESVRTFPRGTKQFTDRGTSVAISPDGQFLASTSSNGLHTWRLNSGKLILHVKNEGHSVAFSPGGFLLATAGNGVRVIDRFDGAELARFNAQPHPYCDRTVAFSPDGRLLAVADTKRVMLWDLVERRELPSFEGHPDGVTSVAFTPDGKALISAGVDGTALLWDLHQQPTLKAGDANTDWEELLHKDRLRAYAAFCRLRVSHDETVTMLQKLLQPIANVPTERLALLIKKLDSDNFQVRNQANQELRELGPAAEKSLVLARNGDLSLETSRRLDLLINEIHTGSMGRRTLVGIALLEEFNTAVARKLLQTLSNGDADSRPTQAAREALQRVLYRNKK